MLQGLSIWPQDLRPAVIADSVSLHRSDSISDEELCHLRVGDDGISFTHSVARTKLSLWVVHVDFQSQLLDSAAERGGGDSENSGGPSRPRNSTAGMA